MFSNTYQQLAGRTECDQNKSLDRLTNPLIPMEHRLRLVRLLHSVLGMMGELGELAGAIERHVYYGQELDIVNIEEELGDTEWYLALGASALQKGLGALMKQNLDKLQKRFPDKFDYGLAKEENRDREGERKVLEGEGIAFTDCTFSNAPTPSEQDEPGTIRVIRGTKYMVVGPDESDPQSVALHELSPVEVKYYDQLVIELDRLERELETSKPRVMTPDEYSVSTLRKMLQTRAAIDEADAIELQRQDLQRVWKMGAKIMQSIVNHRVKAEQAILPDHEDFPTGMDMLHPPATESNRARVARTRMVDPDVRYFCTKCKSPISDGMVTKLYLEESVGGAYTCPECLQKLVAADFD